MSLCDSDTENSYSGSCKSSRHIAKRQSQGSQPYQHDYKSDDTSGKGGDKPLLLVKSQRAYQEREELKLELNLQVLEEVLENCDDKQICVIAVTGTVRSGKSFLLNTFIDRLQQLENYEGRKKGHKMKRYTGFDFRSGIEPLTKGLWIWSRPFCIPGEDDDDIAVLLLDVEGIDSELSKPKEIEAWLTLPLLISSTLIFNTVGDLSPSEFAFLAPLLEQGDIDNYPKLSFLVRDWTDTHCYLYGNGKKYLDSECVTDSFFEKGSHPYKHYDCFLLPHIGEKSIISVFDGSEDSICRDFLTHLNAYLNTIFGKATGPTYLKGKTICGKTVSSAQFRFFFGKYVEFINISFANQTSLASIPFWSFIEKAAVEWKLEAGLKTYESNLKKSQSTVPGGFVHSTVLDGMHKKAERKAMEAFESLKLSRNFKENSVKEMFLQNISQLHENFKTASLKMQKSKIEEKIKLACESLKKEVAGKLSLIYPENPRESAVMFYEKEFIEEIVQEATEKSRKNFVQNFPELSSERLESLVNNLNTQLQRVVKVFVDKNMDNRDRAYERADKAVEKFKMDYVANIKAKIATRPNIDSFLLEDLHFVLRENLENKFAHQIKIGTAEFTKIILDRFRTEVAKEFEKVKAEMNPPHNQYEKQIHDEVEIYKSVLISLQFGDVIQLHRFHQESIKELVQRFLVSNKIKTAEEKIIFQLQMELNMVYESVKPMIHQAKSTLQTSLYKEKVDTIVSGLQKNHECNIRKIPAEVKSPKHDVLQRQAEEPLCTEQQQNPEEYVPASQNLQQGLQKSCHNGQTTYVGKRDNEDIALREARLEASKTYQTDMKYFFEQNKNAYLGEAELAEASLKTIYKILTRIDRVYDLNFSQRIAVEQTLSDLFKKCQERNEMIKRTYIAEDLAIGIDLGTTYCCVAVFHKGRIQILYNEQGENTTPCFVCMHEDGETEVGSGAKNKCFRNLENTIYDAKRIIGKPISDQNLREDMKYWPFKIDEKDSVPQILVHGEHYFAQEISSFLLKHLKEEAEKTLNKTITKAVITVPAYFSDGQRQATIDAGEMAGLEVLGIINEPTAAAIAFRQECFEMGTTRKVLVYDFGGGTFDVSVLAISDIKLEVLGIAGDSHLGGEDLDRKMMEYCAKQFERETGIDIFEGKDDHNQHVSGKVKRNLNRLQRECEKIKKGLASTRSPTAMTQVSIDGFVNGEDLVVDINRNIFDKLSMEFYERTLQITDKALKSAGLSTEDVDDVVLVGGSTRIRKVQEMLSKHFGGKVLNTRLNPDEAIAYGAAVQAALLNSKPGSKPFDFGKIQEVTSMSYGIQLGDNTMDVLIAKSTKIPVSHTEEYKTFQDNQTSVRVPLYQGDDKVNSNNIFLGTFSLDGIPPGPAGSESIDVTMKIDLNGTLSVEAVCRSTKGKRSLVVTDDRAKMPKERKNRYLAEATA